MKRSLKRFLSAESVADQNFLPEEFLRLQVLLELFLEEKLYDWTEMY